MTCFTEQKWSHFYQAECVWCASSCVCVVNTAVYRLRCHHRCSVSFFFLFCLFYFNLFFIIIVISTKSNTTNVLAWAWTNTLINTSISFYCVCALNVRTPYTLYFEWHYKLSGFCFGCGCSIAAAAVTIAGVCVCAFGDLVDYLYFKCMELIWKTISSECWMWNALRMSSKRVLYTSTQHIAFEHST